MNLGSLRRRYIDIMFADNECDQMGDLVQFGLLLNVIGNFLPELGLLLPLIDQKSGPIRKHMYVSHFRATSGSRHLVTLL